MMTMQPNQIDESDATLRGQREACLRCDMHRGFVGEDDAGCAAAPAGVVSLSQGACPLMKWRNEGARVTGG